MQSIRPLLNLTKRIFTSPSVKPNGHKISLSRSYFGAVYSNTNMITNKWYNSYRLFASSTQKLGIPDKIDLQPGDHAVGLEALEQHALRKSKYLPYQAVLTGAYGTFENPVLVPTVHKERLVGCCGGSGEHHEPGEHDPTWFVITEGAPVACPVCAQVFKLVPDKYPEEFINILSDPHEGHDHHHGSGDNVHDPEIEPITYKDVDDVLSHGYTLKKPLKVSEYIDEVILNKGHGHDNKHKTDSHTGHKTDTHAGHKTDTHAGHKTDSHTGHKTDSHTGHKTDTRTGHKADPHAGHKH